MSWTSIFAFLAIFSAMLCWFGCDSKAERNSVSSKSSSIQEFNNYLPNLNFLAPASVDFETIRGRDSRSVPSPSDEYLITRGYAELPEERRNAIKKEYSWEEVGEQELPIMIVEILPEGTYLTCPSINESFNDNATFAHGFVVMIERSKSKLYFVSSDIDNPLDYRNE
ncbi:MAG: hypothetical protein AAGG38_14495 [Planctomycetota bacterium]